MASETGISNHHKMIMTMFRSTFAKDKPKTFYYRCYKNFNLEQSEMELKAKLDEISNNFDIIILIFFLKNLNHVLINSLHLINLLMQI